LVVKEEGIVKMVDGSLARSLALGRSLALTERDGTVCALEAVWYVPEAATI